MNHLLLLLLIYHDKKNTSILQQINFIRKSEGDNGATNICIAEKQQKINLKLFLDSLIVTE